MGQNWWGVDKRISVTYNGDNVKYICEKTKKN